MDGKPTGTDVVVVGAGPAGSSAAIWCANAGLRVTIIEGSAFPRNKPGETLHPGLGVLFKQLGVEEQMALLSTIRHTGYYVKTASQSVFTSFGNDSNGQWQGYQILRADLDTALLNRAKQAGVKVLQPCKATGVILHHGKVTGVTTTQEQVTSKYVIDATGTYHWLQKQLGLNILCYSKPLVARYGYATGELNSAYAQPVFKFEENGWLWIARIGPSIYNWTRLVLDNVRNDTPPTELKNLQPVRTTKGADVTWRIIPDCTGPGYFMIGDACSVFDPSVSRGVLRGIYSGMTAADIIVKTLSGKIDEGSAVLFYKGWQNRWFYNDLKVAMKFYSDNNLSVNI